MATGNKMTLDQQLNVIHQAGSLEAFGRLSLSIPFIKDILVTWDVARINNTLLDLGYQVLNIGDSKVTISGKKRKVFSERSEFSTIISNKNFLQLAPVLDSATSTSERCEQNTQVQTSDPLPCTSSSCTPTNYITENSKDSEHSSNVHMISASLVDLSHAAISSTPTVDNSNLLPMFSKADFVNFKFTAIDTRLVELIPMKNSNHQLARLQISDHDELYLNTLVIEMTAPENILKMIEIISTISQTGYHPNKQPSVHQLVSTKNLGRDSQSRNTMFKAMIKTAHSAQKYVTNFGAAPSEARLRLILSYVTLYLTLEYAIVPMIQGNNPSLSPQEIKGRKWKVYYDILGGKAALGIKEKTFRDNISYGKVFWSFATSCGITILPILACLEYEITVFARKNDVLTPHAKVLGSLLTQNRVWISLCHSLGVIIMETLFTTSRNTYSMVTLAQLFIAEPLPFQDRRRFQKAYYTDSCYHTLQCPTPMNKIQPVLSVESSTSIFADLEIHFVIMPSDGYPNPLVEKLSLVNWGLSPGEGVLLEVRVGDKEKQETKLLKPAILASFFTEEPIPPDLVGFYIELWNGVAIPGWMSLTPNGSHNLLQGVYGADLRDAVEVIIGPNMAAGDPALEFLLVPVQIDILYFLLICCIETQTVTICSWVVKANYQKEAESLEKQMFLTNMFRNWSIGWEVIKPTTGNPPECQKDAVVQLLYFLHLIQTGSHLAMANRQDPTTTSNEEIIVGCLLAACEVAMDKDYTINPLCLI
ncbi:hypothetical protein HOY82DRAFT_538880 [Tuber indicum]|nr:hypothetical protein HOY82DRAFT_538880 [Tuber indicum]